MIAACASQTPLRTNDLVNAVEYISRPNDTTRLYQAFPELLPRHARQDATGGRQSEQPQSHASASAEPAGEAAPEGGFLAGEAYYAVKEQLISDEQVLLRTLRFQLALEHPHKHLLSMCRLLSCSQPLTQLATCLVRILRMLPCRGMPNNMSPIAWMPRRNPCAACIACYIMLRVCALEAMAPCIALPGLHAR